MSHAVGFELAAVLGMVHPASFEPDGVAGPDKDGTGKPGKLAALGAQTAGRKLRASVEDGLDLAVERCCFCTHCFHLAWAASR